MCASDITLNNQKVRRFSKTTGAMLHHNKIQAQNSIINKFNHLAENIAQGNTIQHHSDELKDFNNYFVDPNYNAFSIDAAVKSNGLLFTLLYIYHKSGWSQSLPEVPMDAFKNLAYKLQTVYRNNPYHNQVHGADVCQMIYTAVNNMGLREMSKLNEIEIFTTIISGAAHDIDHPGTNNVFEIKCKSKLALLYNDQSVLENHHTASFFFLVDNTSNNCDIMQYLTAE